MAIKFEGISENTKIFSITSFLTDLSSEMIVPLLPLFLVSILHATKFEIGLIEGIGAASVGLFSLFSIDIANRLNGNKKTAIAGYGLSSLIKIGFVFSISWIDVLIIRFVERAGKGFRTVVRDSLIADSVKRKNLGLAFGVRQTADMLGKISGPLVAGLLLILFANENLDNAYRNVFLIASIIAMVGVFFLILLKDSKNTKKSNFKDITKYIISKKYRWFMLFLLSTFLANFSIIFFVLRASDFLPYYLVPFAYVGFSAMFSIFSIPSGILSDKLGYKKLLSFGFVAYLFALILFAYYPSVLTIFLGFVLVGLFSSILEISSKLIAVKIGENKDYNVIFGAYQTLSRTVKLPSNIIAGFLWVFPLFGAPSTFAFGIIITLLSLFILNREDYTH